MPIINNYKIPVTHQDALTAIMKCRAMNGDPMPDKVAWTLRLLVFQHFRPSGQVGEFADRELAKLYAPDFNHDPVIEAEVIPTSHRIEFNNVRDILIGPIRGTRCEDHTPPDYSVIPRDMSTSTIILPAEGVTCAT